MSGFEETLTRVGMAIGFWVGLGVTALAPNLGQACVCGGLCTALTIVLAARDARKARSRYRGDRP